jgi:hypothetical protein
MKESYFKPRRIVPIPLADYNVLTRAHRQMSQAGSLLLLTSPQYPGSRMLYPDENMGHFPHFLLCGTAPDTEAHRIVGISAYSKTARGPAWLESLSVRDAASSTYASLSDLEFLASCIHSIRTAIDT